MLRACKWAALRRSRRRIYATQPAFSTASFSCSPSSLSDKAGKGHEDWRDVGVFWDIENCSIPANLDPYVVRPNIERALRTSGLVGPIHFAGYANIKTLSRGHTLESLSESGIAIHHVPSGGRDASDRALLIDVMFWTMKHSPPAHILLITGDSDFSVLMNKLRLLGYNVLLAACNRTGMSSALVHAASKIWVWPDIIIGEPEGLIAKTHIPGTPLPEKFVSKRKESEISKSSMDLHEDSRYGFMKDVLGDSGRVKLRDGGWLPPSVVDRIVNIVKDRPGITLGELIEELKAMNINPKLYGYHDYHHCLSRIEHLEFEYIDGVGPKSGAILNVSRHAADKKFDALPKKDSSVSCGYSDHKEASDGYTGSVQPEIPKSTGEILYARNSTSIAQRSWGSCLISFFKGS